jgi:hypothetical protein
MHDKSYQQVALSCGVQMQTWVVFSVFGPFHSPLTLGLAVLSLAVQWALYVQAASWYQRKRRYQQTAADWCGRKLGARGKTGLPKMRQTKEVW